MFIPTTIKEVERLGWSALDVVLITGDAYIDSPFSGVAVIGKVLLEAGFRVGIIAQPDITGADDITRLGEPRLFWGVSGGAIDSMVANRTATNKKRRRDDYTPGGKNDRRPERATIVYSNLIRRFYKSTAPIVLGGIEASLRRVAHYDFWSNKIRRSILFDAKADYLIYGMGEGTVLALASVLKEGGDPRGLPSLSYLSNERPEGALELPSYEVVSQDKDAFTEMFHTFYNNNDPVTGRRLVQRHGSRYLIQNKCAPNPSSEELDRIHNLTYERDLHPYYARLGPVKALETIRFSISTHRGCYGECAFCAIAVHQGRAVRSRSKASILKEAREITRHRYFKGRINDVGGPTANMYATECEKLETKGGCTGIHCLLPKVCSKMNIDHGPQIDLLRSIRKIDKVKKVVVASGIRHDMILADKKNGTKYLKELVSHHVSGQMKIAPEHSQSAVLALMIKPESELTVEFKELFYKLTKEAGKDQYLTYYMIAAHPGCTLSDMEDLRQFSIKELGLLPEQIQVFTPTPSTYSTLIYWTGRDPFSGKEIFVEYSDKGRERQKAVITGKRGALRGNKGRRKN